jgi:CBS domain containing-hemolysin-like protein
MVTEVIATAVVLLALVFFSTIESAYESMSEVSLRIMVGERESSKRAAFFRELLEYRQRFELLLVLGTQLSTAAIAILIADVVTDAGVRAPLVVAFVVVFLTITVFRQFIPRLIAQNHPEQVIWRLLPVFRIYYRFFSVVVAPVSTLLKKVKKPEPEYEQTAEDEETIHGIQAYIDVGEEEGIIEEAEGEMIQSIIEFGDKLVGEVMRPRLQIVAIEATATVADARKLIIESKYSQLPVYRDVIDNIEGLVHVRDLLVYCEAGKDTTPVTECMRTAYFIPESKPIAQLLEEMQKAKVQMAMVINEYGGVAGLVTIEDIIEEILGEIEDEDRPGFEKDLVQSEDGSYLVDGRTEIRKVEMLYDKEVEADDFTTVAGLLINELGHVPKVGESLEFKGLQFEVVEADSKRVNRVRLRPIEQGSNEEKGSPAAT